MCISVQCSVALELGAECTYPVAEGTSSGLLYMIGQGLAIIMISLMDGPLTVGEDRNMLPAMWFCFALILLATVFAFAFRGKYLRLEHSLAMAAGAGVWPMRFRTTTLSAACPANRTRRPECMRRLGLCGPGSRGRRAAGGYAGQLGEDSRLVIIGSHTRPLLLIQARAIATCQSLSTTKLSLSFLVLGIDPRWLPGMLILERYACDKRQEGQCGANDKESFPDRANFHKYPSTLDGRLV
jgi:hypothetical protein